jgi:superfamily II DNA or RNA helicase
MKIDVLRQGSREANSPSAPVLRPYQVEAIAAVQRELDQRRSTLAVLATGLGKAVIAAALASGRETRATGTPEGRTLLLAPREELIDQLVAKLADAGAAAGVEQAGRRSTDERIVVASPATLRGERLRAFAPDAFARVIVDEAHHSSAKTYRDILGHFAGAKVLGLTATPHRADGQALGEQFESVAFRYDLRGAIRDGWLAPIRARRIVLQDVDLSAIRTRAGDLAADELAAVMEQEAAVASVVQPLLEQAGARKTLVFATSVAHAMALASAINGQRPGVARVGWGEMPKAERKALRADFRAGAFQFLVNAQLYTEGFDEPSVACVAMVRPTKSLALYMQMVGRGTRLFPGKLDLLLLDFTGAVGRHKLVGPIDCLLGGLALVAADVRAELDKRLEDGDEELETALVHARGDAIVRYLALEVDPFIGPDDMPPIEMQPEWETEEIPPHVLTKLRKAGINTDRLPTTFRLAHAYRLLSRLDFRRRTQLCTLRQARRIAPSGIDTRRMSAHRAGQLMVKLRMRGWNAGALYGEPEHIEACRARRAERPAREAGGEERAA